MSAKKFFKTTIIITLAVFLLPALFVVVFDPFFIFHKPFVHKDLGFDSRDRYQNAGLINSYLADAEQKIDTIIVGTSMSQNLPVEVLQNDNGANALKLTLSGGKAKEIGMVVKKAVETGNVKHVIWEVFTSYAGDNPDAVHNESPLPEFLYTDSLFNKWRYVFNHDVVEDAVRFAKGRKKSRRDLDELYTWQNEEQFKKFNSPENITKIKQQLVKADSPLKSNYSIKDLTFPNVEQHILPILRNNPDIQFSLFFPPVSYASYAKIGNENFWRQMKMREFLLLETKDMQNVKIYGFDLNQQWGGDLSNYMDDHHYSPSISKEILESVANKQNILKATEFNSYSKKLLTNVNLFTLKL